MSGNTHYIGEVMMQERKTWTSLLMMQNNLVIRRLDVSDNKITKHVKNITRTNLSNHNKQPEALRECDVVDVIKIT